jgi:uncharacterized repeat protein (TIGR01451 family)
MFTATTVNSAKVILAMLALSLSAKAEVKVTLVANKVMKSNGTEVQLSGQTAKPGDTIEYVADYRNTDKSNVRSVVATLPVPAGMEYLPDTESPRPALASTDGAHFSAIPLKRTVRNATGQPKEELVPYSEYRTLRWNLGEISGGGSKTVKARVKVKTQQP